MNNRIATTKIVGALVLGALVAAVVLPKLAHAIAPNWWSSMTSGTTAGLIGVWGSSANDVFAVGGSRGTVLHYNGTAWSAMTTSTTSILDDVWGSSSTDVYAVGQFGSIEHYNGAVWSSVTTSTSEWLHGV